MPPLQKSSPLSFLGNIFGTQTTTPQFFTPTPATAKTSLDTVNNKEYFQQVKPITPLESAKQIFVEPLKALRKAVYPTFEEQIQNVQNEKRASFLPEEASRLAIAKDRSENIIRASVTNPQTGKSEPTGPIIDVPILGPAGRIESKVGKEVVQLFRSDKLNLPDIQIKDIENRLSALGLGTRTVRTFSEMKQAAQDLGVDPQKLDRKSVV